MSGVTLKVTGIDEVLRNLDIAKWEPEITAQLSAFGADVVRDAKQFAPVDEGFLKSSINFVPEKLKVTVVVNADYAAYLEFGTRKFAAAKVATLPPNWQAFAAEFKGQGGGTFEEMVARITAWVKRKGFAAQVTKSGKKSKSKDSQAGEDEAAYLIARSILINGIKPHPFLFPAFENNMPLLIDRLKNLFK